MIASTAVLPIAGKLSDVYGRKPFIIVIATIARPSKLRFREGDRLDAKCGSV
jgi:MFS family permease